MSKEPAIKELCPICEKTLGSLPCSPEHAKWYMQALRARNFEKYAEKAEQWRKEQDKE